MILSQVNNIGPVLLILGLEILQELIETFISLSHALD
jgi:hypothetical protein